jgi:membrane-anchored protein YejM (alkaline phosphatase superfamily)
MTNAVTGYRPNLGEAARKMLQASAAFWFLTAVVGQWLFVYYIAGFYRPATGQSS